MPGVKWSLPELDVDTVHLDRTHGKGFPVSGRTRWSSCARVAFALNVTVGSRVTCKILWKGYAQYKKNTQYVVARVKDFKRHQQTLGFSKETKTRLLKELVKHHSQVIVTAPESSRL